MRLLGPGIIVATTAWSGAALAQDAASRAATQQPAAPNVEVTRKDEPAKDKSKAWETAPATHRGGFAVGVTPALGIGASNGFPADSKKIGRLDFYTESGVGLMAASSLWLGGALADWLTFGVGGGYSTILNGDTESPAPYIFFHADVYPLSWFGGQWRNLGVMTQFGLGFPATTSSETDETLIDGGGSSFVLAGVFWEGIEAWKMKMGPYLATHYMWSDTIRRPSALLGFRVSLYTLP